VELRVAEFLQLFDGSRQRQLIIGPLAGECPVAFGLFGHLISFYFTGHWLLTSPLNRNPHTSCRPRDHADRVLRIASVQIFPLFLHDLSELRPRDLADLLLVRHSRTLGDARFDLQQCRSWRALAFELKRAVAIDRHDHWNRNSVELARPLVEL